MFHVALFLHVFGVILLAGAVGTALVTTLRVQTARSVAELRTLIGATKHIESVLVPAMIIIIVTGVFMVSQRGDRGGNPWTAGWVVTSEVVTVLLAVIGRTVEARDARRLHTAVHGATSEWPQAKLSAVQAASSPIYSVFFGTSQVVALLFLMTNRPNFAVSIAACVLAAVVSASAGTLRLRSVRRRSPAAAIGV